jgi:ferric-dicitrate binding protein FerR (iron transport regulator)
MREIDDGIARRIAREMTREEAESGLLPALDAGARDAAIDEIVARADALGADPGTTASRVPASGGRRSNRLAVWAAAAALAALAIGVAFARHRPAEVKGRPATSIAGRSSSIEPRSVEAREAISGEIATGVRALFEAGTRARVETAAKTLAVVLERGAVWVHVDPRTRTARVSVRTNEGEVAVEGTVFRVAISDGGTEVRVLRGAVALRPRGGSAWRLAAGERAALVGGAPEPMELDEIRSARELLETHSVVGPGDLPIPAGATEPPAIAGATESPQTVSRGGQKAALQPSEESGGGSIDALLSEIRRARAARDWPKVSALYEALTRGHRGEEAAEAAMVSLGQVRLEKLGDPASALRWFDAYLVGGGRTLRPEALQGRAEALRSLGKSCDERRALAAYCESFPNELFAGGARRRLAALDGAGFGAAACPDPPLAGTRSGEEETP